MDYYTKGMGIPALFVILLIIVEFFGSLALILGWGTTRLVALLGIAVDMLVAVWTVHRHKRVLHELGGREGGRGLRALGAQGRPGPDAATRCTTLLEGA
jgi:uncharacterized membrane protein YphA (DoxX/SURF4 family)